MNASEIVNQALAEAGEGVSDRSGDGEESVSLVRFLQIDPEIADELGGDGDSEDEGDQGADSAQDQGQAQNGADPDDPDEIDEDADDLTAEDAALSYLDTVRRQQAEDAAIPQTQFTQKPPLTDAQKRHDTPIENCRAKDPLYCRYHGAKAMERRVADEFAKAGVKLRGLSVEKEDRGRFVVRVSVAKSNKGKANAVLDSFGNLRGFRDVTKENFAALEGVDTKAVFETDFDNDQDAKLDEYIDSAVRDFATTDGIDKADFVRMLVARADYDAKKAELDPMIAEENALYDKAAQDDDFAGMKNAEYAIKEYTARRNAARNAAEDAYHFAVAQVVMKDIKTYQQVKDRWDGQFRVATGNGLIEGVRAKVEACQSEFGVPYQKRKLGIDGYEEWARLSRNAGYMAHNMQKAQYDYSISVDDAHQTVQDIKRARNALHTMEFASEQYAKRVADANGAAERYMAGIRAWAEKKRRGEA